MMKRKDYQKPTTKTVKLQHYLMQSASPYDQKPSNGGSMPGSVEAEEF